MPTDKYQDLLQEKGGNGFPHLVFLDAEGNLLESHEGDRSPAALEQTLGKAQAKAQTLADLKKKADGGDSAAKLELLLTQLELGHLKADAAKARAQELKDVPKDKQAKIDGLIAGLEVGEILGAIGDPKDQQKRQAAGKQFAEMKKAGRVPSAEGPSQAYWILMMEYSESQKDAAAFEEELNALKARLGEKMNKKWVDKAEARLKALKGGGGK